MVDSLKQELKRKLFSVKEYYQMARIGILPDDLRFELLNGEIIEMSPILSPHASCVAHLCEWFILNYSTNFIIRPQSPITIGDHSEPEPDIAIAKKRDGGYKNAHPTPSDTSLVIEVSDSTIEKDRKIKIPLYSKAGIPEYWIVNLKEKAVEVYSQPSNNGFDNCMVFKEGKDALVISEFLGDNKLPLDIVF